MKLYLSSVAIPNEEEFQSLFVNASGRIGLIPDAWGPYAPEKSEPYIASVMAQLNRMGFSTVTIELKKFAGKHEDMRKALVGLNGVWVTGGNTYYLRWAMRESGFDTIIPELCASGLVYGGESAGAVAAGSTLHGIELLDNPEEAPEVIWDGLKLVDYGIVPHWGHEKYGALLEQCKSEMEKTSASKALTDRDYILTA